jgi:hypothetical protein
MSDPRTAGPAGDGSKSLARESKLGHTVAIVSTAGALALVDILGGLDTSGFPVWLQATATAAVGTAIGVLTSYAARNRAKSFQNFSR